MQQRIQRITVYLTEPEYHTIRLAAARGHLSMAAYLRLAGMEKAEPVSNGKENRDDYRPDRV